MIKADNTQKRCLVACDEQTKKDGRCSCLINTHQTLQLLQPDVMPCFSVEQIERINKYARHQYNRGQLDLPLVSFDEWVNKA